MKEIKPEHIKQYLDRGQTPKAVLKRLWDTKQALGHNFLAVVDIDIEKSTFYIPERVLRGGGWITRKIENFRFFI